MGPTGIEANWLYPEDFQMTEGPRDGPHARDVGSTCGVCKNRIASNKIYIYLITTFVFWTPISFCLINIIIKLMNIIFWINFLINWYSFNFNWRIYLWSKNTDRPPESDLSNLNYKEQPNKTQYNPLFSDWVS